VTLPDFRTQPITVTATPAAITLPMMVPRRSRDRFKVGGVVVVFMSVDL
jgi:hypothetical protein